MNIQDQTSFALVFSTKITKRLKSSKNDRASSALCALYNLRDLRAEERREWGGLGSDNSIGVC